MAHGDARYGKWRGNMRVEWVASALHTTSEHGVSSITTADAHTSAASSRLNWRPPTDLNGLVRCAERPNLVSAHVPSHFKRALHSMPQHSDAWKMAGFISVLVQDVSHPVIRTGETLQILSSKRCVVDVTSGSYGWYYSNARFDSRWADLLRFRICFMSFLLSSLLHEGGRSIWMVVRETISLVV